MAESKGKMSNQLLPLLLIIVIMTAWWTMIFKEGMMYRFVWLLFSATTITAWVMCIKIFYKTYKEKKRDKTIQISFLFDILMLHTVIGIWGMLLSSDEGTWDVKDIIVSDIPFWLFLMSITYSLMMCVIYIKEKKIFKGVSCIFLSIVIIVVGGLLFMAWVRGEIGRA